ncbi:sugar phosphate nucleotidyltransferase [Paenibacillus qinlingensis]|uniref:Mannose-1-phosphate guanylyltransferase n=1 Tax=Paenibacillus qinlingensis TaxID=1837343 RepID=A0ABU1P1G0_9BACL|nr:sugar phosphate nucleotidyltransferase [Paenibacillus qinlingensis]MDR6553585.1 mannose-1-phosphate guanylyltransferase [Paenibacillus qinlingensis]
MKIVLLSGGSGSRLWPLSNDSRAKQFLKVLENDQGEKESMVQRVFCQLTKNRQKDDIIVATSSSQVEMLHSQIGTGVPIIIEPERRDTFPAIALACSYIYSVTEMDENEVVGIVSVDAYVHDRFYERVFELESLVKESDAEMALLGIKPTYASSKYGYLIPKSHHRYLEVDHFTEKPTEAYAEELIQLGSYWNSGVFAFPLKLIVNWLRRNDFPVIYDELLQRYSGLPKNSFDYEVVEHLRHIVALTYDGYWKDLGTWNTLTEEMSQSIIGNGRSSSDCENTHIINELDLPVKVLGISNAVVAVSADGILVTDKSASSRMKEMLTDGLFARPMYEERRWGWSRVLDYTKQEGVEILTRRLHIDAGKSLEYQQHLFRREMWTIISGKGKVILDGIQKKVAPGDVLEIPAGLKHALLAETNLEYIEVQIGSTLVEEDVVRLSYDWSNFEITV